MSEFEKSALQPTDHSPRRNCGNWLRPKREKRKLKHILQHKMRLGQKVCQYLGVGMIDLVRSLLPQDTELMIGLPVQYH